MPCGGLTSNRVATKVERDLWDTTYGIGGFLEHARSMPFYGKRAYFSHVPGTRQSHRSCPIGFTRDTNQARRKFSICWKIQANSPGSIAPTWTIHKEVGQPGRVVFVVFDPHKDSKKQTCTPKNVRKCTGRRIAKGQKRMILKPYSHTKKGMKKPCLPGHEMPCAGSRSPDEGRKVLVLQVGDSPTPRDPAVPSQVR